MVFRSGRALARLGLAIDHVEAAGQKSHGYEKKYPFILIKRGKRADPRSRHTQAEQEHRHHAARGHRQRAQQAAAGEQRPLPSAVETKGESTAAVISDMIAQRDPVVHEAPKQPVTPELQPVAERESSVESESPAETVDDEESAPQSLLGGLDPADRITGSDEEEDLLDIPAFLRRQAN